MTALKNCSAELRNYLFSHKLPEVFEVWFVSFCMAVGQLCCPTYIFVVSGRDCQQCIIR